MHGFYDWGFFAGGHMLIFWILLIIVLIWLILSIKNSHQGHSESAQDIAKKRYAAGEISKKELDEIIKNLS